MIRTILRSITILVLLSAGAHWWMKSSVPAIFLNDQPDVLTKVDADVLTTIEANGAADFVVQFSERADLSGAGVMGWQERGEWIYQVLQQTAEKSQGKAIEELQRLGIRYYSSFGGNRLFVWNAGLETLSWLASLEEVQSIYAPRANSIQRDFPDEAIAHPKGVLEILSGNFQYTVREAEPQEFSWAVIDTQADQFWNTFNLQGEGIVVAGIDTGIQYDHPALDQAYKCQDDPGDPACWFDPENNCGGVPCDPNGHGTATMGPIVGDDDPSLPYQVGVAPGAQWIACMGCNAYGYCSDYALTACADWAIAPGGNPANRPQVIFNSWGGAGCNDWFDPYVDVWMAAGIVATFSPGGSGPGCGTLGSPGDYPTVFTPTAHDSTRLISNFAGLGPSCFGHEPFTKPNISAPGVDLHVPIPPSSWATYSGTSFSNSYGAGGMVLLLSCSPDLIGLPYDLMAALQNAADTPPEGYCGAPPDGQGNYTYGYGYLNLLQAGVQNCGELIGILEGHVKEAWTEIPLAEATVQISPTLVTVTDASGYYSFTLPPGTYTATATLDSYEPQTISGIEIGLGQPVLQDFDLLRIAEWTSGPNDPSLINRSDCAWFDDGSGLTDYNRKAYCLGGRTSSTTESPNIWVFDPISGLFADTGDDMIEDVSNYTANVLQDEDGWGIYVVGGFSKDTGSYIDYVQRYDPASGQVSLISSDPWPLKVGSISANPGGCAVVQNKIYCFGAFETDMAPYFSDQTWEYDPFRPAGSRWQQITTANLSVPRGYINVAVQGNIIYAMGGTYQYSGGDLIPTNVVEALDVNDQASGWQVLTSMSVATAEGRGFGFSSDTLYELQADWQGKIYVIGGGDWPDYTAEAMEYDIASDTWSQAFPDLVQARKNHAGTYIPLCTPDPYDGLPGMWVIGGYMGSCEPPFAQPEYYPFTCTPQAEIQLVKTVGTDPAVCAESHEITVPTGTQVTYCFELVNSGEIPMTVHDLVDSQIGEIWSGYELEIPAWSSTIVTRTVQVQQTITNTATWTASDGMSNTLQASDMAVVNVLQPSIVLTKTVGIEPETCSAADSIEVAAGSEVTYCYEVKNQGTLTFTMHDLEDSQLGELFSGYALVLSPGESATFLTSTIVMTDVVNTATWTAYAPVGQDGSATDTASVYVVEPSDLVLVKTVGLDPNACADTDSIEVSPGTQVTYCYKAFNFGDLPFVIHDLVDSSLGDLLTDYAFTVQPGESTYLTRTVSITVSVTNTATWTAYTEEGTEIHALDTATVYIAAFKPYEVYLPVVYKNY